MISYNSEGIAFPKIRRRDTTRWLRSVAALHGFSIGEVGYVFCNDEKILEINRQYLSHDYYTDIITFDYTEGSVIHGDIFISLDTVRSNAVQQRTDYEEELHRVIVHDVAEHIRREVTVIIQLLKQLECCEAEIRIIR